MSEQLDLWPLAVKRLPWGGARPRDLTRGSKVLYLRRKPQRTPAVFDPTQLDFFKRSGKKAPWFYQGAPLLQEI